MIEKKTQQFHLEKSIIIGISLLLPNSGYLVSFAESSIFYLCNVLLHVGLGLLLFLPILFYGRRYLKRYAATGKELSLTTGHLGYWLLVVGMGAGLYLTIAGAKRELTWLLHAHITLCVLGVIFFLTSIRRVGHQISIDNPINTAGRYLLVCVSIGACIPVLVKSYQFVFLRDDDRIHNPHAAPTDMAGEAMNGAQGVFYPSSIATFEQDTTAGDFLLRSEDCGQSGCHPDIYRQWQSSAHFYSDFKNLWYRAAISEAELKLGTTSTKWCAGCHVPATLLRSEMRLPASLHGQLPSAHSGISCTICHAIVDVRGTMGQGGFIIEEPKLFGMITSRNAAVKNLYALFVHLDPAPHRATFGRPFHRNENGAFCSSCHKAHTDAPLNQARWLQIMNDYDSWQASSFGQGDRDFDRAEEKKDCVSCHLPYVSTSDGKSRVRDHRFLGANTLLPMLNEDNAQLQATIDFLRDNRITLDVFAVSRMPAPVHEDASDASTPDSTMSTQTATVLAPQGDEVLPTRAVLDSDSLLIPITGQNLESQRGHSVRLDVVVRSRDIGHSFPTGAADMAQAWLELKIVDEAGKIIFWSGARRGEEIDPGAHFYGVEMVDSTGQSTSHVRSWEAAATRFVNLLPPNGAEIVRYRVQIPEDCGTRMQITARLNYRKFRPAHLQWLNDPAKREPGEEQWSPKFRTGVLNAPVVALAQTEAHLYMGSNDTQPTTSDTTGVALTATRWQNYGIGLLRQNELDAAERAFQQAQKLAPDDFDLALNLGIIHLRSARVAQAKTVFQEVIDNMQESARAHYYLGMALKAEGNYGKALNAVKKASDLARRDREFRLEIGRLYHLLGDYRRAIRSFKRALRIDPEDPEVYHEMMKTYLAEGDPKSAARVEQLYRRFGKDDAMRANERNLRQALSVCASHLYHEHHSAAPSWQSPDNSASNGNAAAYLVR